MTMPTLTQYALGIFLVLHGAVHFWYVVLSQGWVEADDAMGWEGRSWLLSGVLDERFILDLGSVLYVLIAIGFAAGGVGLVLSRDWWAPLLVISASFSTIVIGIMWDGAVSQLVEKGIIGILINLIIIFFIIVW